MSFKIERNYSFDNIFYAKLIGRATIEAPEQIKQLLNDIRMSKDEIVVFDLSELTYLNSSSIGSIIEAFKICMSLSKKFYLMSLRPEIQELFKLTGLISVIPIVNSMEEVLNQ